LSTHATKYLEVGSAMGATAVAISDIEIHCVDNWENNIQSQEDEFELPFNTRKEFDKYTRYIKNLHVHEGDFLSIDKTNINGIDLFFYDGPHDTESTRKAISYYKDCLADVAILVFDDANWSDVVKGVELGISDTKLNVLYSKLINNDIEDMMMWWNGLYIMVVKK
jgi:predicted O-methyltransferase YrrM